MDIIWNNPEVDQAVFFTEEAFKKYSHEPSLREHLCAKAAELDPGLDLLVPPPKPPPPPAEEESVSAIKGEEQDEQSVKAGTSEGTDINEFQRIARQRLEAWRKAADDGDNPSTSQKDEGTSPSDGKGKHGKVDKTQMWLESGKPEPIEVELPPLPEDQPAKKKALPMKGKACEVPYPQFSCLNKVEQAHYMKLHKQFQNGFPATPSPEETKDIQTFKEMQVKVVKEQKEYMEHLENAAKSTPEDYKYMHHEALRYMEGVVPNIIMPPVGGKHGRPHVPLDFSRIQKNFPTHPPDAPDVWNKPTCSRDPNVEKLTKKYKPQVVMSSSALRCLIDNHAPSLERNWELPIVIREFSDFEDGEEYIQRVVYIDKPFPPKALTTRDKNLWYHRFGLKTILQHPFHMGSIDIVTGREIGDSKEGMSAKHLDEGTKQELISGKIEDSLFGMVDTAGQDTFGTSGPRRKKSVFSFMDNPKSDSKSKPPLIKFVSGGTTGGSTTEVLEKPSEDSALNKSEAAPSADTVEEVPEEPISEVKSETTVKKKDSEENEKAFCRRESEGFIVTANLDEDSRSSTDSRSPQARVRTTRSRAGSPKAAASSLSKDQEVKPIILAASETDTSDDEDKLLIDIPDSTPTRLTRSSSRSALKLGETKIENKTPSRMTRTRASSDVTGSTPKASLDTAKKRSMSMDTADTISRDPELEFKSPPKITRTSQAADFVSPTLHVTRRSNLLDVTPSTLEDTDGKVKVRRLSGQAKRLSAGDSAEGGTRRKSLRGDGQTEDVVMETATEETSGDPGGKKRMSTRSLLSKITSDAKEAETTASETAKDLSGQPAEVATKTNSGTNPVLKKVVSTDAAIKSPLDDILTAQDKLHAMGRRQRQTKPPTGTSTTPAVSLTKEPGSVPNWMPLEDPAEYLPPARHNVLYNMWTLGDIPLLLRSSYHGNEKHRKKRQSRYVSLLAKLEYQPHCGYERETISEVSRAWLAMYTRRNSKVIQARINVFNSEVMYFKNLELQNLLHPQCPFNPQAYIVVLHGIINRLTKLPVGSYLLSHTSGNSHCHIKKSVDTNIGVYDLHVAYASPKTIDDPYNVPWIPIDPSLWMPFHRNLGRIPATFIPPDPDRVQTKKKKKKKNYKAKKDF